MASPWSPASAASAMGRRDCSTTPTTCMQRVECQAKQWDEGDRPRVWRLNDDGFRLHWSMDKGWLCFTVKRIAFILQAYDMGKAWRAENSTSARSRVGCDTATARAALDWARRQCGCVLLPNQQVEAATQTKRHERRFVLGRATFSTTTQSHHSRKSVSRSLDRFSAVQLTSTPFGRGKVGASAQDGASDAHHEGV